MSYFKPNRDLPPPQQEQLESSIVFSMLALAFFLPFLGPLVAIFYGTFNSRKAGASALIGFGLGILLLQLVVGGLALGFSDRLQDQAREAVVKANLQEIQALVERYGTEHDGNFPLTIDVLAAEGYMAELPQNPFTRAPMHRIRLGDEPFEGEFSYAPRMDGSEVPGYTLLAYGSRRTHSSDIEHPERQHVIAMVSSGMIREADDMYRPGL